MTITQWIELILWIVIIDVVIMIILDFIKNRREGQKRKVQDEELGGLSYGA